MHDLACRCEMITRCCVPAADSSPPAAERGDGFRGDNERSPRISLYSPRYEARSEARRWLSGLLCTSSGPVVIRNNFIQHFGESKHQQLSRLTGVTVNEFIEKGRAHLNVSGQSVEDVAVAVLEVEAMLCDVQREFVMEEKSFMHDVTTERLFSNRKIVFWINCHLVENPTLETLFDLKRAQLHCTTPPQQMFQRIPAHFCEMVSQVGFHAEFAPPKEPAYGAGIYFARTAKKALEVWKWPKEENEEYVYFVEAEVLTGNSTRGEEGLILPPAVGADPNVRFDSVSGPDVAVIFSGYQARPKYIITCTQQHPTHLLMAIEYVWLFQLWVLFITALTPGRLLKADYVTLHYKPAEPVTQRTFNTSN
uniref:PARP catalytic domain-containing protein n=1 Tax=Gasterosteus aculeatus aculeatus TaxID=481459 RepID=A0AAQ4P953_GASAC